MRKWKFIIVFLLITQLTGAQDFKVNVGAGFPDLIHIKGAFELTKNNEIAVQLGTIFTTNTLLTPALEHRLYYRKSKKNQDINTWFFGQRATYFYERSNEYTWHSIFLNVSIGRDYYFTKNFGFTWDAGVFVSLMDKQFDNSSGTEVRDDLSPAKLNLQPLPNFRIQLFRRI